MATLQTASGDEVELTTDHTVGRSRSSRLRVRDERVSGHHAAIRWTGQSWELRDLGSRNGTWLDDERLPPGAYRVLDVGCTVAFGDTSLAWRLTDASPPIAHGVCGDRRVVARDQVLVLPDERSPCLAVLWDDTSREGRWLAEHVDGRHHEVEDGDVVDADGAWTLFLPIPVSGTLQASAGTPVLVFRVSADEERVDLWVERNSERTAVPERVHHYALLTLARQRLADRAAGLPPDECGWVYADELAKGIGVSTYRLNVYVHRARKQLQAIADGLQPVERRLTSHQLRLGVARVQVLPTRHSPT